MRTRCLLAPCLAGFLVAWAVGLRASPEPPAGAGGSRGPPPPISRTYRFEDDVLAELSEDRDRDGRPETWQSFVGGDLVRLELDRDGDGKADWRETWEPDPNRPPLLQTQLIEGRWRIVPYNVFKSIQGQAPSPGFYHGKAEKNVGGRWVDMFEDVQTLVYGGDVYDVDDNSDENKGRVVRRAARWRFEAGKPVEAVVTSDGHYTHVAWKEGRPLAYEDGAAEDKLRCVEQYRDGGVRVSRVYYDEAGNPTSRLIGDPASPRWEVFRDGEWTGDYEDTAKDARGRITSHTVYRDGRLSLYEMFEPNSGGALIRRTRYEADRSRVEEHADPAGNVYLRSRYAPDGTARGAEKLVDGRWVADFEVGAPGGSRVVYRGGRLVRQELGGDIYDEGTRVAVFHDDGREEWGDGKVTRYWYAHSNKPGLRRRVREARDLDGDGKADLKVDYERLTVEQPAAAAAAAG